MVQLDRGGEGFSQLFQFHFRLCFYRLIYVQDGGLKVMAGLAVGVFGFDLTKIFGIVKAQVGVFVLC